jgi:NAD(P)-dependent dehydrogenase (short-subunit alcohol dehydrogenase family)
MRSVFLGVKHAARVMIPRHAGVILNTSSTAGVLGGIGPHAYTACKHATVGLTKSAASELSAYGIRVNAIAPGAVLTPLAAGVRAGDSSDLESALEAAAERLRATSPLGFTPLAMDVAQAALYLASDEARFVSGHILVVDGGQTVNGKVWKFSTGKSGGADS